MSVNAMTINQKYYWGAIAVILAMLAGTIVAYPKLPTSVPIHWNAAGRADDWGPKWSLFLWGPGMMTIIVVLFRALPWLSPRKFEIDSFRATYLYIMSVVVAMIGYIYLLMLLNSLGVHWDITRAISGGVCMMIALLGNVMGKVRRNFYVGIRTPWTIADERVWNKTHRLGAKTFFVAGWLGLLAVLSGAPFWLPIAMVLAGAFIPAIYSLVFYKQLEHRGELNA
ncbi:MAG: SdpI family protein [Candidatus Sulfotelmatobacter sp.]